MEKQSGLIYGEMGDRQLNISQIIEFGAQYYPNQEIVTRIVEDDSIHRYTFAEAFVRAKKSTQILQRLGIKMSDRVATVAMNTYRHFEIYYGISGYGAIMNTINPRFSADQFTYVVNHSENRIIFVDPHFVPLIEKLFPTFKTVEKVIVLTDRAHMPESKILGDKMLCYEELLEQEDGDIEWEEIDERLGACLCYTSGTTGNPKGILYSHRSIVLHAMRFVASFAIPLYEDDVVLPVVPMFHVNAWGLVYNAPMCGFKLVFPGAKMDGASIYELINNEKVTVAFGVPTVWNMLLKHCRDNRLIMESLKNTIIGGASVPLSMIEDFYNEHQVKVIQVWGMTELSPLGVATKFDTEENKLPMEQKFQLMKRAGKAIFGTDLRVMDDDGKDVPFDGETAGNLLVRGTNVAGGYFKDDSKANFLPGGWFKTGDICTIDQKGWMCITDRSKDVIKSGGEWISSIYLENAVMGHPKIFEAAVIGLPHPKWDERPLLIVVKNNPDEECTVEEIMEYLTKKVAKFWLPNDIVFRASIPKQATGKIYKLQLRKEYQDHVFSK